jgi:PAS domain S-box-containing protein
VGLTGWLGLWHLKGVLKEINGVRLPGIVGVAELQGDMWAIQRFERVLLYEKDPEIIKRQYTQLEEAWNKAGQLIKKYELLPKTKAEGQLWDKIASKWEAWKVLHQTVIGLIKKGDQNSLKYAHELSYGKARTVFLESQEIFTHLLNISLSITAEDHERAETSEYRARIIITACTLAGVLGVLFLGFYVTQSIQKSHEALRKSENWFSTTLRSIGDAVIATDPQGQITFMNSVAQTLTGWPIEEGLGRPIEDVFHIVNEETGEPVENPVTRVIREGLVVGLANHTVLIAKDGTRVPINDSGAPIKDDQGNIIGAVLVFHDITELKQAMDALRRREQETWVTVNNIPGIVFKGYVDGSVDPVDHFNDKVEPLTGYSKADFDYRHLKWTDLIVKEDLDGAKEIFLQALKSDNKAYVREYRIRNREGKEAWIQERSHIICDPSGKVENISGILFDITERKQAEKVIAEQTRILEAFFQYTPTPLAILDKDLHFIRVNQAYAQSGTRKLADFLNHNHYELYPPEAQEIFEQVIRTKAPFQKSGQPFVYPNHPEWGLNYWDWSLTPLLDSQGEVEFLILSLNEVTESKRAEEALRASEEEYRLLFENAQVGVFRGRIGDGKVLKANQRLAEMFGYENHQEFLQEFVASEHYVNPGDRDRLITNFQNGEILSHEIPMYRKDGSILWLLVSCRLNPEKGCLEGVATDITALKEMEDTLKVSEAKYRQIVETANEGIWAVDRDFHTTYINKIMAGWLGYEPEEILGRPLSEFLFPDDWANSQRKREERQRGLSDRFERRFPRKDGSELWALVSATDMMDDKGEFQGSFGMITDITDRKHAEERYGTIVQTALDGFLLVDTQRRILEANQAYCKMSGYTQEELVRMTLPDLEAQMSPEEIAQEIQRIIKTGEAVFETRHRAKDGRIIDIEVSTQYLSHGESGLFYAFIRDITDRKQAEEQIHKNQLRLQVVFDGIPEPLVMVDRELRFKLLNRAALRYYQADSSEAVVDKYCYQVLKGLAAPCAGCEVPAAVSQGEFRLYERQGAGDPARLEEVFVYPLPNGTGQEGAAIIRISDVTEARMMERHLLQSEKLASLGLLVAGIAHEINNPNSFITFNIPILRSYLQELLPIVDVYARAHPDFAVCRMPYGEFRRDIFKLVDNLEHGSSRINATVAALRTLPGSGSKGKKPSLICGR